MNKAIKRASILLGALVAPASALEPGETALTFLKSLQANEEAPAALLQGTAISPHTGKVRRAFLARRLEWVGRYLRTNQFGFEVLAEKRDGDFVGVIVSAVSRHDPLEVDVLSLGLLRQDGDEWRVAPVPGSFDNVYLGFDEVLEKRAERLEDWMGLKRLEQLQDLQQTVVQEFRDRMSKAVPREKIENATPAQLVEAFVDACAKKDPAAAMVLLGQFEGELGEDERALQRILSRGIEGLDRRNRWGVLTSPDVVRLVVQDDPGDDLDADVALLVFNPRRGRDVTLVRFVLLRVGKRWTIELPNSLRMADADRVSYQRALLREQDEDEDEILRKSFETHFEKRVEPRRASSLKEAGKQIESILRTGTLEDFFRFIHRSDSLSETERRIAYQYLGEFWNEVHEDHKAASDGELIEIIEHEDTGVLVFHLLSTSQKERVELSPLVLLREDAGWAIAPGVTTSGNYEELGEDRKKQLDEVVDQFLTKRDELSEKAKQALMKRFAIAKPAEAAEVAKGQAADLVKSFRSLLREGKLLEAFEHCALLDPDEGAWEALRALSYEYRGARQAKAPDRELGIECDQGWAAVSLRIDSGAGSVPDYPLYLVVATSQGPRIVVDVGLRLATNKGREELNRRVWKRIEEQIEEKETALVRSLFEGHVTRSKSDLAEWEKSNKSSP